MSLGIFTTRPAYTFCIFVFIFALLCYAHDYRCPSSEVPHNRSTKMVTWRQHHIAAPGRAWIRLDMGTDNS
jgi:hypothetical protein